MTGQKRAVDRVSEFWAGEYEHRNPALFIVAPNIARSTSGQMVHNLWANRERLVSHFDVFRTLEDLAHHETVGRAL